MMRNLLSAAVASSLAAGAALAPVSALANTRAGDAGVRFDAPGVLQRLAAPMALFEGQGGEDEGISTLLVVLLFGAAATGIILAVESTENQKSPGT